MKISHIAAWTDDIDCLTAFYTNHFGGVAGEQYENPAKGFTSRFVRFQEGPSLEIMRTTTLELAAAPAGKEPRGWTHLAFSVGSQEAVDTLTETLRESGHPIVGEPRTTGDGFYESVVLDPDGNRVEITD